MNHRTHSGLDAVPPLRLFTANDQPEDPRRGYVLYWMTAARRLHDNPGFDHSRSIALRLGKPVVVLEALRCDWPWASRRTHRFVAQGMLANTAEAELRRVTYHPYLEPHPGAGKGLLEALAANAVAVIADAFPCTFVPRMLAAAARKLDVAMTVVDGNGLLPLAAAPRAFDRAVDFRRFLQRNLGPHLRYWPDPDPDPLPGPMAILPAMVAHHWPATDVAASIANNCAEITLASGGGRGWIEGGAPAAKQQLTTFLNDSLARYSAARSHPDAHAASELSAWLHWGHLSAHTVVRAVLAAGDWSPERFGQVTNGSKDGWWGVDGNRESFLDELVTWRELGYGFCHHRPDDYDRYDALPTWALKTLAEHSTDQRAILYTAAELEAAATHDPVWNAAQNQLVREGRMHNYLRMLWGKKILEWSPSPQEALSRMIALNNLYALDGTNPNSYTGMMWVLGRFDRPWVPQRPIYGAIRYMTSGSTVKKLKMKRYLERFVPAAHSDSVQETIF